MRRYLSAIVTMALLAFVLTGCKKEPKADPKTDPTPKTDPKADPKETPKPAAGAGLEKGNPKLVEAFKAVLSGCEVSDWGFVRRKTCKDPEAEKNLKKQEKMVGLKEALTTYCYALSDKNHLARALASYRISTMNYAKRMTEAADADVFKCMLPKLKDMDKAQHVRRLAKAITYMGTALKMDKDVLAAIDGHKLPDAKVAGYEALWANGRLRVFPSLEAAVKGKDPKLQVAAIKAFGYGDRPTPEEKDKICGLLIPLMVGDDIDITSSAAYRVASVCTDKKDDVIKAATAMIGKNKFNLTYVSALRTTAGWFREKATKPQQKAIVGVLKKVLKNTTVSALTRSSSLSAIYHVDNKEGKKVAKKYKKDKEKWVAQEADRILKK